MPAGLTACERRTLDALHERLFPAGAASPDALAIGAADYVAAALTNAYASDVPLYRRLLAALDAAAGGDFAVAPPGRQDAAIGELEAGRLAGLDEAQPGAVFDLAWRHLREGLFGDPMHGGNHGFRGWAMLGFPGAQTGYDAEEQQLDRRSDRPPRSAASLPEDTGPPAPRPAAPAAAPANPDVVIVGGGAVGSFLARKLVLGGLQVVLIEAGPTRTGRERRMDELTSTAFRNDGGTAKFNRGVPTWRRHTGETATRAVRSQGLETALGGNSVAWGAVAMRFYEDDFCPRSLALRSGGGLPDGTTVADWPLRYPELSAFYDEAEDLLGVSGQAWSGAGAPRPGNPFEAPRARPYAMPALRTSGLGALFAETARGEGYHPFPLPAAILTEPFRGRQPCTYCSFCSRFGCHVDAKASAQNTVLLEAVATGRLTILTGARATAVLTDAAGRAVAVRLAHQDGSAGVQAGGTIVLATYTFENVRLLLRSVGPRHARGLGNETGQVGAHYITRQQPSLFGVFAGRELNRFIGPTAQAMAIADLSGPNLAAQGLGFIGGGRIAAFNQYLPVEASGLLPPDVQRWGAPWRDFLCDAYRRTAMLFIDPEILSYETNRLDLDPEAHDDFGEPVVRITFDIHDNERRLMSFLQQRAHYLLERMGASRIWARPYLTGPISTHDVGGTRMGLDPEGSVVDANGQVHDTPGLVVLGGSTFVSLPSVNPFLTILALALRAGEAILRSPRA